MCLKIREVAVSLADQCLRLVFDTAAKEPDLFKPQVEEALAVRGKREWSERGRRDFADCGIVGDFQTQVVRLTGSERRNRREYVMQGARAYSTSALERRVEKTFPSAVDVCKPRAAAGGSICRTGVPVVVVGRRHLRRNWRCRL